MAKLIFGLQQSLDGYVDQQYMTLENNRANERYCARQNDRTGSLTAQPMLFRMPLLHHAVGHDPAKFGDNAEAVAVTRMTNYSERDLFELVRQAGFQDAHLEMHIDEREITLREWASRNPAALIGLSDELERRNSRRIPRVHLIYTYNAFCGIVVPLSEMRDRPAVKRAAVRTRELASITRSPRQRHNPILLKVPYAS